MFRFFAASIFLLSITANAFLLDDFEAVDSPLPDFVRWVSAQSGKNVVVSDAVESTINVHVQSLDSKDLIPFFRSVMVSNGFEVVEKSGSLHVIESSKKDKPVVDLVSKLFRLTHIRNTKAVDLINTVLNSSGSMTSKMTAFQTAVTILTNSNAVLVTADKKQIRALSPLLSKIDQPAAQILIEAVIMESDVGQSNETGVNLKTALNASSFSLASTAISTVTDLSSSGITAMYQAGGDMRSLITALENNQKTKILSTPIILVMDREQGHISVGQNVPFITSTETTDGGKTVQNIQRQDVGVSLTVRPHRIGDHVILEILQESSSVTGSTQAADIITNQRKISTVARVTDGQTIQLGGLISDEERILKSGVPVLMHIPWLGRLFRHDKKSVVKRELTVLIKTTIL